MILATDNFNGTSGELLTQRTASDGATTYALQIPADGDFVITPAGRVRSSGAAARVINSAVLPSSALYSVEVFVTAVTVPGAPAPAAGLVCGATPGSSDGYLLWISNGVIDLWRNSSNVRSSLNLGLAQNDVIGLRLTYQRSGAAATLTVSFNKNGGEWGEPFAAYTDATALTGTRAGLRLDGATTDTTGLHIDNLSLSDTAPGAVGLTISNINQTATDAAGVALAMPTPIGGSGTYTYQWHRSTTSAFTPSGATAISGATAQTLTQTGLTAGTWYFYKCVVTSGAEVATSYERPVRVELAPLRIAAIGDSISVSGVENGNSAPISHAADFLSSAQGQRTVSVNNRAINGTSSESWTSGSANMNSALTSIGAASIVFLRLGMNDAQSGISAATFSTNMTSVIGALTGAGHTVVLSYPTYREGGSHTPTAPATIFNESTTALLLAYQPVLDGLINGTTVLAGDKTSFEVIAQNAPALLYDRIHPNALGAKILGIAEARAYLAAIAPAAATTTARRTISRNR